MSHLFFDIENYISPENKNSGLNPYTKDSKVIVISYTYYKGFKPPGINRIKPPTFLKEWESSEEEILFKFHKFIKKANVKEQYPPKYVGFNITSLDLPYLFGRMKKHKIASESELYDLLFRPYALDLYQLTPLISGELNKYNQLWGLNHRSASEFFNLRVKVGTGDELSKFYDNCEYDKIMKYCTEEFNFEMMMDAFYLHILNLRKIQLNQNE